MSVSLLSLHLTSPPFLALRLSTTTYIFFAFTALLRSPRFITKSLRRDSGAYRAHKKTNLSANELKFVPLFADAGGCASRWPVPRVGVVVYLAWWWRG